MRKIGKIAGYFLRSHACSVALALDNEFAFGSEPINNAEFNDFIQTLMKKKTIVPIIVMLDISRDSYFDLTKFVLLNESFVNEIVIGEEILVSRRAKMLGIKTELHDWAWRLLNTPTFEDREKLINKDLINVTYCSQQNNAREKSKRGPSSRSKIPSTKYPSEMFITL